MLNYLLLLLITLSMHACLNKPSRRPPVLVSDNADQKSKGEEAGGTTFKDAGYYLALHNDASSGGYQPLVLHIDAHGTATSVTAHKVYSRAALFRGIEDLSQQEGQAINLLLAFEAEQDSHCIAMPLTEVLQLVSGDSELEITQRLIATSAQPLDLSTSKGKLEPGAGGQQCVE